MADLLTLFTQAAKLLREAADEAMSQHGVRVGQHIVLSALMKKMLNISWLLRPANTKKKRTERNDRAKEENLMMKILPKL